MSKSIGLVGARGYVGAEMLTLLGQHPEFECAFACSSDAIIPMGPNFGP